MRLAIRASGLWERGLRNYLDVRVVHQTHLAGCRGIRWLHDPATDGFTCRLASGVWSARGEVIAGLEYDRLVVTGDFRTCTYGDHSGATAASIEILRHVAAPVQAILGNHDFLSKVPLLEAAGLQFLLNEHLLIERDGAVLALIGIDDSSFYGTHNFARAMNGLDAGVCKILLSHSPNTALQAAALGIDLLLAGHTHGGQICLPGGIPLLVDSAVTRARTAGAWTEGRMRGYTSRGTGATGLPVRLNCPAEVTLHRLRCVDS